MVKTLIIAFLIYGLIRFIKGVMTISKAINEAKTRSANQRKSPNSDIEEADYEVLDD